MALNPFKSDDERIAKRADNGAARADRSSSDRPTTENRELTDSVRKQERYAMLRDVNTLLPQPPELPGYHLCWLTTTNNKDTLENRSRLGYTLVNPSEMPDFKIASQKDGQLTNDRIQVNEMVLAKIPYDLWLEDMTYLHHDLPAQEIRGLRDKVNIGQDGRGRKVAYTGGEFSNGVADGYDTLISTKPANFAGVQ